MIKFSEIQKMDARAIDMKLGDVRKQLFEARMLKAASGLEKPHLLKEYKRSIARLLTVKANLERSRR